LSSIVGYDDYVSYYREVSRADWYCPSLECTVSWKQGDPLGTGPSIGILSLSNAAAAFVGLHHAMMDGVIPSSEVRQNPWNYFRVLGDDICMDARLEPYYERVIKALGGEINHSKTLTSDKVAEFAGRVIVPTNVFLKKIRYCEPSDNSFMDYMSQLGDQAKFFLRPRQRQEYEFFKYVPGIAVNGPWLKDSLGVPFQSRYLWYLEEVEPVLHRLEPDLQIDDYQSVLLKADLSLAEAGQQVDGDMVTPFTEEGYLPSSVTSTFKVGGDPRLVDGLTVQEQLNQLMELGLIKPFDDWNRQRQPLAHHKQEADPKSHRHNFHFR
jgi:hypothetical protein